MDAIAVVSDLFSRGRDVFKMIDALTLDELHEPPAPSIAWQVWRMGRSLDHNFSPLLKRDQLWITDSWHQRFDLPADDKDFQPGFPPANDLVTSFRVADKQQLADYFDATYALVTEYLATLTPDDLDTEIDAHRYATPPTIGIRLVSVGSSISHSAGAIRYRNWMAGRKI
jgi:hypothetical protein